MVGSVSVQPTKGKLGATNEIQPILSRRVAYTYDPATDDSGVNPPSPTETSSSESPIDSPADSSTDSPQPTSLPPDAGSTPVATVTTKSRPVITGVPGLANNQTLNQQQLDQLKTSCSALQQWYKDLGGPQWLVSTGWNNLDMTTCCSWTKVTCNKVGGIEKIHLSGNQLVGSIPINFQYFPKLVNLDMSNNNLTGMIPDAITRATSIQTIHLANNTFNGTIPDTWANLPLLKTVDLKNNQLSGPLPASLANYRALESLSLSNNAFSGSLPANFGNLPLLKSLNIMSNQLSGQIPDSLGNITTLLSINLKGQGLTGSIPVSLGNLINLIELDLSRNNLTSSIPPQIGNLIHLERLRLDRNALSGDLPNELGLCVQLQSLALNYNAFTGTFPSIVAPANLAFCRVVPNQFSAYPPDNVMNDYNSLAFQCALNNKLIKKKNEGSAHNANHFLLLVSIAIICLLDL
ncbi:hypothetical protein NQZ79_g7784 [Umbelopsis isabellina]|nr:hypothetical protein NQZ79_g7784 [Umbelopsis isabellina]